MSVVRCEIHLCRRNIVTTGQTVRAYKKLYSGLNRKRPQKAFVQNKHFCFAFHHHYSKTAQYFYFLLGYLRPKKNNWGLKRKLQKTLLSTLHEKCPYSEFFDPYIHAFGLNIQSEYGKTLTRKTLSIFIRTKIGKMEYSHSNFQNTFC